MKTVRIEDLLAHAGWVRALAHRLVRDAAAADDLVQEAWLAALRKPPRANGPLRPWLAGVVRNLARMRSRGEGRRARHEAVAPGGEPSLPPPDVLAGRLEMQRKLAASVAELAEPLRSTLLLRFYEGLSSAEIARRLDLPAGTVRWRLKRGLDELRTRLDSEHGGDRRAWCLALVPLAGAAEAGGPGAGATLAKVTQGAVVMGMIWKVAASTAAVAALVFGLAYGTGMLGPGGEVLDPETAEELAFRPLEQRTRQRREASEPAPSTQSDTAGGSAGNREDKPASVLSATIKATLLDEAGRPLEGASLQALDAHGRPVVTSDAGGRVELIVELPAATWDVSLRAGGDGVVWRSLEAVVKAGTEVVLGEIRLAPAGAVSGRVVDTEGNPVPGSWIGMSERDLIGVPIQELRRWRRSSLTGDIRTQVAADGSFQLTGVPVGRQRLWAGEADHLSTPSRLVEVRAGQESYGLELVLEPLDPEDLIEGMVVAPDGSPIPRADLRYRFKGDWGGSGGGTFHADREGRFRIIVRQAGVYRLTATDPDDRWGGAQAEDVRPGQRDLVLRLPENRYVPLVVRSRGGDPVTRFGFSTLDPDAPALFDHSPVAERDGGRDRIRIPGQPFHLVVDAPGFDEADLGPFDPDAPPAEFTVDLIRLPGVRGLVTAEGRPVAGARVSVHAVIPEGRRWVHNGFVTRWNPQPEVAGETGDDGAFELTLRASGDFVVRVEADGLAPSEWGPQHLDHRLGRGGLDIAMSAGGAITGAVHDAAGRAAAGTIVAVSRADGHARTQRVGADGTFLFEGLTPGAWIVRRHGEEIREGTSSTTMTSGSIDPDWNATVSNGATIRIDLGVAAVTETPLTGRLVLDGRSTEGWAARLLAVEGQDRLDETVSARIGEDGHFALTAPAEGVYRLSLMAPDGAHIVLVPKIAIAGSDSHYELEIAFGRLEGVGAPPLAQPGSPRPELALMTRAEDGAFVLAAIHAEPGGTFVLEAAPAGLGRIVRMPTGDAGGPETWPTLAEVTVPVDGTAEVDLTD